MKIEYKKDLKHNYMVISDGENGEAEVYGIKMLKYQTIEGILPVESRWFDNSRLLYYDITAKQSMSVIYEKALLTKDKVQQLCAGIINTLEKAYEYLLPENDFILDPDYIYLEVVSGNPVLCYLPGYSKGIKEQMNSLMEYLMNKVDYSDREAVLLVYQLYAISREEGFTFDHLMQELNNSSKVNSYKNSEVPENQNSDIHSQKKFNLTEEDYNKEDNNSGNNIKKSNNKGNNNKKNNFIKYNYNEDNKEDDIKKTDYKKDNNENPIPMMMEKLEGEEEIPCYPLTTYIYTGVCLAGGIILIILGLVTRVLYNSYGNRIDSVKLAALMLIVFCVEGYILQNLWNKKNRITRIVTKSEYIDPSKEDYFEQKSFVNLKKNESMESPIDQNNLRQKNIKDNSKFDRIDRKDLIFVNPINDIPEIDQKSVLKETLPYEKANSFRDFDPDENPTCLLNPSVYSDEGEMTANPTKTCVLKALDEEHYQSIQITDFPFFIGKLKKNVDYCLENEVISRYHAKITKEEGCYYITDLNSTNGTFLNNTALQTYEKKEVQNHDEIAFANIKYQFDISF